MKNIIDKLQFSIFRGGISLALTYFIHFFLRFCYKSYLSSGSGKHVTKCIYSMPDFVPEFISNSIYTNFTVPLWEFGINGSLFTIIMSFILIYFLLSIIKPLREFEIKIWKGALIKKVKDYPYSFLNFFLWLIYMMIIFTSDTYLEIYSPSLWLYSIYFIPLAIYLGTGLILDNARKSLNDKKILIKKGFKIIFSTIIFLFSLGLYFITSILFNLFYG